VLGVALMEMAEGYSLYLPIAGRVQGALVVFSRGLLGSFS